jgi:circadian clock protein KaiC
MTGRHDVSPIRRLGTASPTLNQILGGGLPERSVTVIAGEPGTGKTILALQLLFHLARQGLKSVYFTTLSEPALKLIRYMQLFSFFDHQLLDERIVFADLGAALRANGSTDLLGQIVSRVEQEAPDVVVIDSFKAIHDLLHESRSSREFVYDLAVQMAGWGATTLLVGEYTPEEVAHVPDFAIADGIIRLTNKRQELSAVRELEVLKLRGANYETGGHFFEMDPDGLTFYPRVRAPDMRDGPTSSVADRVSSGVLGLDELLAGGLPRHSATLVQGGSGTGKTLASLHFLVEGARQGERGILFTLEETPDQLRDVGRGFGWDLHALEAGGLLEISYTSPIELSTDRFLYEILQRTAATGARRVVLDSVNSARMGVLSERRFHEFVYALAKHFRSAGATLVMTLEITELLGTAQLTGHGVSSIADNIVLLRYVEAAGHLERAISVLKARGVPHLTELRRLEITAAGIQVGPPFVGMRGVLTGLPVPVSETMEGSRREREG